LKWIFSFSGVSMKRREFVKTTSGAAALGLAVGAGFTPATASAQATWNKAAFEAKSMADVVKALGGSPCNRECRCGVDCA
jgi:sulfur-oxidizing protein SoxY